MATPSIEAPTVKFDLGGVGYELVPSLRAAQAVSQHFGGYGPALQRATALDLGAITYVLRAGVKAGTTLPDDFDELVWRFGAGDASALAIELVTLLINGGRRMDLGPGSKKKAAPKGNR